MDPTAWNNYYVTDENDDFEVVVDPKDIVYGG